MNGSSSADGKKGKKKRKEKNLNNCNTPLSICRLAAALHWTGNSSHAPQLPAGGRRPQESGKGPDQTLLCCSTLIPAPLLTKESHTVTGQKCGYPWRGEPLGCLGMETGHLEGLAPWGLALLVRCIDCEVGGGISRLRYPDLAFVHASELRRTQLRRHPSAYRIRDQVPMASARREQKWSRCIAAMDAVCLGYFVQSSAMPRRRWSGLYGVACLLRLSGLKALRAEGDSLLLGQNKKKQLVRAKRCSGQAVWQGGKCRKWG
ncbi:hypothetical protein CGRA01v4_02728 [Colletotrichum graminicola]|nr:hypothetical protein CGRA01v4_02728 [Colletotrichum graminicola]